MKLFALISIALAPLFAAAPQGAPRSPQSTTPQVMTAAATSDMRIDVVRPYDTDIWTLTLTEGESHLIVVAGDGSSDLDAYLYDENGNLIDMDQDATDVCVLAATPRWTGSFELRIVNRGSLSNRYVLTLD